jgi:DNA repair protein RadC
VQYLLPFALAGPQPLPTATTRFPALRELTISYRTLATPVTPPQRVRSSADTALLCAFLQARHCEECWALCLNAANEPLALYQVGKGGTTSAPVDPAEVFRAGLLTNSAAVLVIHNHPSGWPAPSASDRALTQTLVALGAVLHVPLLDHVIIGCHGHYSFADKGLIAEYQKHAETWEAHLQREAPPAPSSFSSPS